MTARLRKTGASLGLALLALSVACTSYTEIPIETPISPKLDVTAFQRVFIAGFIAGANEDVDANMETVRLGRTALKLVLPGLGILAESRGFLAGRNVSLADLGVAAHLSALDYYGEVPWAEVPALTEWYSRMKSRPSFRPLLADRAPGQPPVPHYAELDF